MAKKWARYDWATKTLEVDFPGKTPSTYAYYDFPPSEWEAFQHATNKGSFFAEHVRFAKDEQGNLRYRFERLK